jgi:hypothetical protein
LPRHATALDNELKMTVALRRSVPAVSLGTALERGGTMTAASGWRSMMAL